MNNRKYKEKAMKNKEQRKKIYENNKTWRNNKKNKEEKKHQEKEKQIKENWPRTIQSKVKEECIRRYRQHASISNLQENICAICGELKNNNLVECLNCSDIPNVTLLEASANMEVLPEYQCGNYIMLNKVVRNTEVPCCNDCLIALNKETLPQMSIANNLQIGDPPNELCDLTIPEQILISPYRTKMQVIKLKAIAGVGTAQWGLKGNSITFPQDTISFVQSLPPSLDDLPEIIKVIFIGSRKPKKQDIKKVLEVRKQKVVTALNFLKDNHKDYKNILISKQHIDTLPDHDIPKSLWETIAYMEPESVDSTSQSTYHQTDIETAITDKNDIHEENIMLLESTGMVDINSLATTEESKMKNAAKKLKQQINMIPHGKEPTNEYSTTDFW